MKKLFSLLLAAVMTLSAAAFPKALYVKKGDTYTKYNFGVAGNLHFSNGGKTLTITGYSEAIDLDNIDYITFTAPVQKSLTASEQKAKMIEIGKEIDKRVDVMNVEEALKMHERFFRSNKSTDWYSYAEYEIPQEYWDVHNEFSKNIIRAACGDMGALAKARAGAANIYKFEDYCGIYNANSTTRTWERIARANYFEMRFRADDGDNYFVRLCPSADFTSYDTPDYKGQLPRTIDIILGKGSTFIADGTLKSELVQDKRITFDIALTSGKYFANEVVNILNNEITATMNVKVDGEQFVNVQRKVQAQNLLVYDDMHAAFDDARHWHDENGDCQGEDYTALTSHFIRANSTVDVLGLLQAKGSAFGLNKIYTHFKDKDGNIVLDLGNGQFAWANKILKMNSDKSVLTVTRDDINFYEDWCNYLNNYSDVTFYYDNKSDLQGYLTFDTGVDEWQNIPSYSTHNTHGYTIINGYLVDVWRSCDYDWHTDTYTYGPWDFDAHDKDYNWSNIEVSEDKVIFPTILNKEGYYISPLLTFPDLTTFAFEDFFTESSFKTLINDCEDIADTYNAIFDK